jgi:hypothetical protein
MGAPVAGDGVNHRPAAPSTADEPSPAPGMRSDDLLPLVRHMEWADALMWRAVLALPAAGAAEPTLREYLAMWRGVPLTEFPDPVQFADLAALGAWARPYYAEAAALVSAADAAALARPVHVPHSERLAPPGGAVTPATFAETVLQVTSHTTYHRGQVAMQVRALGGEPPLTDFVTWIWLGRPAPGWADAVVAPR